MRLWQVRHARAQTYSGGMKRRLSLVISTIGDPKIIFMDEPTTGMVRTTEFLSLFCFFYHFFVRILLTEDMFGVLLRNLRMVGLLF